MQHKKNGPINPLNSDINIEISHKPIRHLVANFLIYWPFIILNCYYGVLFCKFSL